MSPYVMILGLLLFAIATALLVLWGMRKAYYQKEILANRLLSKSSEKVMHYLKHHATVTEEEIRHIIEGTKVSEFYSRNRGIVQNDRTFSRRLVEAMLHDGLIEPAKKGCPIYKKRNKKVGDKIS